MSEAFRSYRRPAKPTLRPRRVRSGLRLEHTPEALSDHWIAGAWIRLMRGGAVQRSIDDALEYAQLGQTKRVEFSSGRVSAQVQGRQAKPYDVTFELTALDHEQWEHVIKALADETFVGARMLSGELPEGVDTAFRAHGRSLLPGDNELRVRCTCPESGPWCKHACCVAMLAAQRLHADPRAALTLRGMEPELLLERIRHQRTLASSIVGIVPAYERRAPVGDGPLGGPLDTLVDRFWEAGPELEVLDIPISPPEVSHPLLRRLGPSPFAKSRFPLVGLLATCYDVIGERAVRGAGERAD